MSVIDNNRRIAKNTIMLYFRMFFVLLINLYTSRIVLSALGVSDYGIYGLVYGTVTMLSFLNGNLTLASQRFLSIQLTKNEEKSLKDTFQTTLSLYFILAFSLSVILMVVVGVCIKYYFNISPVRLEAALISLVYIVLTMLFTVLTMPFISILVAREKLSVYAYFGIIDVLLKLTVVLFLEYLKQDKLILYSFLLFVVSVVVFATYYFYCRKVFYECKGRLRLKKAIYNEMLVFTGWSAVGSMCLSFNSNGSNIIINIFYSTSVNAAFSISTQVASALQRFLDSLSMAVNPQIIKYFATNEFDNLKLLSVRSAKFNSYLYLILILPLILELEYVLNLWLGVIPPYVVAFTYSTILQSGIKIFSRPLLVIVQASGKVKYPTIYSSILLMLNLPVMYVLLSFGFSIKFVVFFICLPFLAEWFIYRNYIEKHCALSLKSYFNNTILKFFVIVLFSFPIPLYLEGKLNEGFLKLLCISLTSSFVIATVVYNLGLSVSEKEAVKMKITYMFKKIIKEA